MKQKIIELFNKSGKMKIHFNPAIKIQPTPQTHPMWIDDVSKVNEMLFVTLSTIEDGCKKNIEDLTEAQMTGLLNRLNSMFSNKVC